MYTWKIGVIGMNEKKKQQLIAIVGVTVISMIIVTVIGGVLSSEKEERTKSEMITLTQNSVNLSGEWKEMYMEGKWYHEKFGYEKYDQRTKVIDKLTCGGIDDWYESNYASVFRAYATHIYVEKHC